MEPVRLASAVLLTVVGSAAGAPDGSQADPQDIQSCEIRFLEPPDERGAVVSWLWESGLVFYDFDSSVSSTNRTRVRNAMNTMEAAAGVHFIPRTTESSYLHIGAFGGNWSYVGQIGGGQDLSIYNWGEHFIICHELIHAMGRYHQHSRTDRNTYITVNWGNIQSDCQSQYDLANGSSNFGEYDFDSLMHYGQWDCSTGGPTMTCMPGYEGWQNSMGQRTHLSVGDIETVEVMYPFLLPDTTVMYANLGSTELQAGETTSLFSVIKNIGDGAGIGLNMRMRISPDPEVTTDDLLFFAEYEGYIHADDFYYLNTTVTIPEGIADGTWYLGLSATVADDTNTDNDLLVVEIQVGDLEPCSGDINGDGVVNVDDILATIGAWGPCDGCPEDTDGDGVVGVDDVLAVLSAWGPC